MRRWFITSTLLANALISGLVLLLLLNDGGWGSSNLLSATESELLIIVAAVALVLLTVQSHRTLRAPDRRKTLTTCRHAATNTSGLVCPDPQEYQEPFISAPKLRITGCP